ncbi:hypothetical protein [Streptomyces xinghaiensis]|uniref:hypothetical protein n=1 Tax=Streptomyces xinghaiensis TaxID=1038928 RepID=UPI002E16220D|nr:hypothetical protein OG463_10200 [Streptomyces xinghaiensis]
MRYRHHPDRPERPEPRTAAEEPARSRRGDRRRLATLLAVTALCGAALLPGASGATATESRGAVETGGATGAADIGPYRHYGTERIASATLGDDRLITLTAVRSRVDRLAATVRLAIHTKVRGRWIEEDRAVVGERNGWFWYPLTGRSSVCEFSTSNAQLEPIGVSLLITPSIGCSAVHRFHVEDGQLIPD